MISSMDLVIGLATTIFTIMAVIGSESGEARILFTILAASGYFYGGFVLLASAFNAPIMVAYVLAGICILGTIIYSIMNGSAIVRSTTFEVYAKPEGEELHTVNLSK